MWLKFLLGGFFALSLLGTFVFEPQRQHEFISSSSDSVVDGRHAHLLLLSWNIGNGDLEADSRAHTADLPAVAQLILDNDADAVALQELSGEDQLKLLLSHLGDRYRGYVCSSGGADRVDGVLVKKRIADGEHGGSVDRNVRFNDVQAGEKCAAVATFRLRKELPDVVLVSAHADAFNARRRRVFAAHLVDWARGRAKKEIVFVAGDFNFEVSINKATNLFTDDAKHDSETYAGFLKYFRDLARDAGETSINARRIDYVFGPAENVSLLRAEVLRGAAVGRMDHWPLLVEVGF